MLLIAGSGNSQKNFDAGTFETVLWDPVKNTFKKIPTPVDFFCSGHTQLPDGRLLVAGGTARYEILDGEVKRAGGGMRVKNESPDRAVTLKKGTVFRSPSGVEYVSRFDVTVPRAEREFAISYFASGQMKPWTTKVTAAEARVFVEAREEGPQALTTEAAQYEVVGLKGEAADNVYGLAQKLTTEKQDFQGIRGAYEFDPKAEKYIPVAPMKDARWYPTLLTLDDGRVLAVSGLNDVGDVVPGDNEIYDPVTKKWSKGPFRYFPTYPSLFLTKGGKLLYTGSNAGYGPAEKGREAGLWDLEKNSFTKLGGLTDPDQLETSASLILPPAQDQKVMVLGGGGVGESPRSTARTSIVDLSEDSPVFTDGPALPQGTRYLSSVLLPDDTVFTTGGSEQYRAAAAATSSRHSSTTRGAMPSPRPPNPPSAATTTPRRCCCPTAGSPPSAPTRSSTTRTTPGSAPSSSASRSSPRPTSTGPAPTGPSWGRGRGTRPERPRHLQDQGRRPDRRARLMRPSAVTHTTDVEQRSVELGLTKGRDGVTLTVDVPRTGPSSRPAGTCSSSPTPTASRPRRSGSRSSRAGERAGRRFAGRGRARCSARGGPRPGRAIPSPGAPGPGRTPATRSRPPGRPGTGRPSRRAA